MLIRPSLILPVEVQTRELLAKLHLAATAAASGTQVIVGDQREIVPRVGRIPAAVYVDKSIAKTKLRHFQRLRALGHTPVATCEEGLVYRHAGAYLQERINPECFALVARFFTWGEHQRADVAAALGDDQRLVSTGNPRFDLLRPELRGVWKEDSEALRARVGRFVIINSSFARFNRMPGAAGVVELLRRRGTLVGDHGPEFYRGWTEHLRVLLERFVTLVPQLARALPEHTVILRPHPSEDHSVWHRAAAGLANVRVESEGNAIAWMLAADAVVHNSCTTGVEAWMLDRPVFAYMPVTSDLYDSALPNALSEQACTDADLVAAVVDSVRHTRGAARDEPRRRMAAHYLQAIDGPLAADRMVAAMPAVNGAGPPARRAADALHSTARRVARGIPGLRAPASMRALAKQKFPGTSTAQVQQALDALARLRPEVAGVRAEPFGSVPNTFRVWRP